MAKQDPNMPAQQGNPRDDMDDERMRGTEDVRGVAGEESEEDFDDSEDSDEEDEEEGEGSF